MNDEVSKRRRSIRLRGYDYAQAGAYFVTIVTKDRACLFGKIVNGEMRLNDRGGFVRSVWDELPDHYRGVEYDAFMVMPNHVHGVILLVDGGGGELNNVGAGLKPARGDGGWSEFGQGGFKTRPYTVGNYAWF